MDMNGKLIETLRSVSTQYPRSLKSDKKSSASFSLYNFLFLYELPRPKWTFFFT